MLKNETVAFKANKRRYYLITQQNGSEMRKPVAAILLVAICQSDAVL